MNPQNSVEIWQWNTNGGQPRYFTITTGKLSYISCLLMGNIYIGTHK